MSTEITTEELTAKIREHARFVLVEALPPQYYDAGHLPGAINLPLDAIEPKAAAVLPDKDTEVVVYCSGPTCQNSHVAQRKLASMGYGKVRVFSGGKAEWTQAGQPLVTAAPPRAAANG
jgi:rhodanese-related sulfurtransferase